MTTIEFQNTSLWYGEVIALNEVSFKFTPGITGLVGSNGAGKTSSIKLAASLLKPTLGRVTVNGEPIWQNMEYLKRMGYAPEIDRQYSWLTGRQFLKWLGRIQGMSGKTLDDQIAVVLEHMGMTHAADRKIEGYSRGMRQRIKVGQALLNEKGTPEVLLVDEPMSGTDPIGRNILADLFKDLAQDEGVTIVVSSHVLHELERISDRVIVLESGKLVAEGTVPDVRKALSRIPQRIKITTNKPKILATKIADHVIGLKITSDGCIAEVANRRDFTEYLVDLTSNSDIDIFEMKPLDEDLTSVFKLIKSRNIQ